MSEEIKVYAVRDNVAELFGPPVLARNDEVAMRHYLAMINQNKLSQLDYSLFRIGEYAQGEGILVPFTPDEVAVAVRSQVPDLTEVK